MDDAALPIPRRFLCIDCLKDNQPHFDPYMVYPSVWEQAKMGPDDNLCLYHLEQRLHRRLEIEDFLPTAPINRPVLFAYKMAMRLVPSYSKRTEPMPAAADSIIVLRGTLQRDLFRDGGFSISKFRPVDERGKLGDEITIKGDIPPADREELLELTGEWITDPKYGKQVKVFDAFRVLPTTLEGLETYLMQVIDGIGPSLASRLISTFGEKLPEVLNNEPERLLEIKGVSPAVLLRIKQSWMQEYKQRGLFLWLAEHGVSRAMAKRVVDHFGSLVIDVLKTNPYRLAEVDGIGFKTADRMAQILKWPAKSEQRTEAAVGYLLTEATLAGNTFLHLNQMYEQLYHTAGATQEEAITAVNNVVARGEIVREEFQGELGPQVALYLPYLHGAETQVAVRLGEIIRPRMPEGRLDEAMKIVQQSLKTEFTPQQISAIRTAFNNHVSVITGPPGTGKTVAVNGIVRVAEELGIDYVLAAPTGRAAKRMTEVSDREAKTIHRLLGWDNEAKDFVHHTGNPLPNKLFIVDEVSMMDIVITQRFFNALADDAVIVLVGDVDQLPAVGPGTVLRDMIQSGAVPVSLLNKIFRQAEQSLIIRNAHRIREGNPPVFPPKGSRADSYLIEVPKVRNASDTKNVDDVDWVKATLVKLCRDHIPSKFHADPVRDVQVLVPMKKGDCGAPELNKILQEALNPEGEKFSAGRVSFRIGDRVQQHRNNYMLEVFNGDVGFVTGYSKELKVLTIDFYGREVIYPFAVADDLQLAYAMTIHKSQGSEHHTVILVILSQHYSMLERNLLYTANTRAKKLCLYLANKWAVEHAASNAQVGLRNSFLAERVSQEVRRQCSATTSS